MTKKNIRLDGCVLSFPSLFEPRAAVEGAKPKYSCNLLMPPDFDLGPLKQIIAEAAREEWGDKMPKKLVLPIKDAHAEKPEYDGYKPGWHFIAPNSMRRPTVVDQSRTPIDDPSALYAGCVVNAVVHAYTWTAAGRKGVSIGLSGVQFARDGERLDGGIDATSAFDAIDIGGSATGDDNGSDGDADDPLADLLG